MGSSGDARHDPGLSDAAVQRFPRYSSWCSDGTLGLIASSAALLISSAARLRRDSSHHRAVRMIMSNAVILVDQVQAKWPGAAIPECRL